MPIPVLSVKENMVSWILELEVPVVLALVIAFVVGISLLIGTVLGSPSSVVQPGGRMTRGAAARSWLVWRLSGRHAAHGSDATTSTVSDGLLGIVM